MDLQLQRQTKEITLYSHLINYEKMRQNMTFTFGGPLCRQRKVICQRRRRVFDMPDLSGSAREVFKDGFSFIFII